MHRFHGQNYWRLDVTNRFLFDHGFPSDKLGQKKFAIGFVNYEWCGWSDMPQAVAAKRQQAQWDELVDILGSVGDFDCDGNITIIASESTSAIEAAMITLARACRKSGKHVRCCGSAMLEDATETNEHYRCLMIPDVSCDTPKNVLQQIRSLRYAVGDTLIFIGVLITDVKKIESEISVLGYNIAPYFVTETNHE